MRKLAKLLLKITYKSFSWKVFKCGFLNLFMAGYDILGNIAIVKFDRGVKASQKRKEALRLLKRQSGVKTVLEKVGKFSGRLRTLKTKYIAGEKTKEVLYKENSCVFRFNVDSCYFSPRLSSDRLEVASQVKKGERVLVMFGGVAPYAIVIGKYSKAEEIVSVELSRECSKYALENVKRNKLFGRVKIIQGDVRRIVPKLKGKFDRIMMARPNLGDDFLDVAFKVAKKGTIIHYHGFYPEIEEMAHVLEELIESEAKKAKRKVKIISVKKAGDIAPYKYRYRADFKMMN